MRSSMRDLFLSSRIAIYSVAVYKMAPCILGVPSYGSFVAFSSPSFAITTLILGILFHSSVNVAFNCV
ncbi:hypothetical protein B0J13DRAFT_552798, partial [Dactylonectria estremocensis]